MCDPGRPGKTLLAPLIMQSSALHTATHSFSVQGGARAKDQAGESRRDLWKSNSTHTAAAHKRTKRARERAACLEQFAIFCTLSERVAASVVFACCAYVSDFVAACSNY